MDMNDCQNERIIPRHPPLRRCLSASPEACLQCPDDRCLLAGKAEPNPKQAYGDKKVALATFPSAGLIYGALATAEGAKKYGPFNWRQRPVEVMTYLHAVLRHLLAWQDREDNDKDSGNPHIGHAIACLAIIADAIETGNAIDNRPARGAASALLRKYERPA